MKPAPWRPGPVEELLLKSALLPQPAALKAWNEWKPRIDVQRLDRSSTRLLPQVQAHLSAALADDPLRDLLTGLRRKAWYKGRILFALARPALDALAGAGLDPLLLKGAALVASVYGDAGLRPMEDVDVLVPAGGLEEARRILAGHGWRPRFPEGRPLDAYGRWARHAVGYVDGRGGFLDLHWDTRIFRGPDPLDEGPWRRAAAAEGNGRVRRILGPEDLFVHVLDHAACDWTPSLRWAQDAAAILRSRGGADFDWALVAALVEKRKVALTVAEMLAFLKERLGQDVPDEAFRQVRRSGITRYEVFRRRRMTGRPGWSRFLYWRFLRPRFFLAFDGTSRLALKDRAARYARLWRECNDVRGPGDFLLRAPGLAVSRLAAALGGRGGRR